MPTLKFAGSETTFDAYTGYSIDEPETMPETTLEAYKLRVSDVEGMRAQIIEFHSAHVTENDRFNGAFWYVLAQAHAKRLSDAYGCSLAQASGVISALSPAVSWEINVSDAETLIKAYYAGLAPVEVTVSTYGQNKIKAYRILDGAPDTVSVGDQFKPDTKTGAFYRNILSPSCPAYVTVDRHAIGIALGSTDTSHQALSITRKRYRDICDAYRSASVYLGYVTPSALQAATWIAFRREFAG